MQMGPSLQRKGLGIQPQTFALVQVDIGTCYLFVSLDHHLHRYYVQTAGHEDSDVIGERGNLGSEGRDKVIRRFFGESLTWD